METPGLPPRPRLTVDQYHDQVVALIDDAGWPRRELVGLGDAVGRSLVEDVRAPLAVPRFANSAMDGFGLAHGADLSEHPWTVVAEVPAGRPAPARAPGAGQAVRVMTGAPVPDGVDTVIPLEDSRHDGDAVWFVGRHRPGQHIRRPGEDIAQGAVVLSAGTVLAARHLAAAAAVGLAALPVAALPRVAVITTGDELVGPGEPLPSGAVIDSNGPYLCAAVTAAGGRVVSSRRARDTEESLGRALDEAATADLVIVTGGVSVGDRDVTRDVLTHRGGHFVSVAMQPGKPQGCGLWSGVPVVALPGNPVSVAVSFACFVRPLLLALLGRATPPPGLGMVAQGWRSPAGRRQFMPVVVTPGDGGWEVRPATAGGSGSHLVASLARANAFAVVAEEVVEVRPGDRVGLLPVD